ncbi:MAG TPA: hypothetical protein VMV10_25325 [Pirellulales bacterium]|nr:hypothetical protein [Pirellulales bacterium]
MATMMGKKKEGDLRLLKDGVVFGPTDRQGLENLLAAGRVGPEDHVSVCNADWMTISDFLAVSAPTSAVGQPAPTTQSARTVRAKRGDLRIVNASRVVSSLTQDDVEGLLRARRIGNDDLISAEQGPWMRVGDFLTARPVRRAASSASVPTSTAAPIQPAAPLPTAVPLPVATPVDFQPLPVPRASPVPPPAVAPYPISATPLLGALDPRIRAGDDWFVRVRGVHSAPLKVHHVKALYQAKEVTLDDNARHPSWADNDWRPMHSIPELADIVRP